MMLAFRGMIDSIQLNRLIEGKRLRVTVLVKKDGHGLRDNKPAGVDRDSVFLDLLLNSSRARLCFASFFSAHRVY